MEEPGSDDTAVIYGLVIGSDPWAYTAEILDRILKGIQGENPVIREMHMNHRASDGLTPDDIKRQREEVEVQRTEWLKQYGHLSVEERQRLIAEDLRSKFLAARHAQSDGGTDSAESAELAN